MSNTTLSTWRPFLSASLLNDFFEPWMGVSPIDGKSASVPSVNISESATSYNMEVAAPGFSKDDIKLALNGHVLTISGQKTKDEEVKEKAYTRKEHNYSSFSRSFTLPDEVQQGKISAKYEHGILNVILPKDEKKHETGNRTITIN